MSQGSLSSPGAAERRGDCCPYCGGEEVLKAGRRTLKSGEIRQLFRCTSCDRRFSTCNGAGKHTDPEAILQALVLICRGYTYAEILDRLKREYGVVRDKSVLTRWLGSFPLPWLEVRDRLRVDGPLVRSHVFSHAGLRYHFEVHRAKLLYAKRYPKLISYLERLPSFLNPELFEKAARCSQLSHLTNPAVRHYAGAGLCQQAGRILGLSPNNRRRHATLQTYFLYGDRSTIASEVPVYLREREHGLVAGHIDLVQIHANKLLLLDYKPGAAKLPLEGVVTQLTLYALALGRRAAIPLGDIECVWFDERDAFYFDPLRSKVR
ncbi:MAG: hypothetical protein LAT58_11715 [Opitutales bacterium]|nr:hypothetical protein [Opitutales bacterium]